MELLCSICDTATLDPPRSPIIKVKIAAKGTIGLHRPSLPFLQNHPNRPVPTTITTSADSAPGPGAVDDQDYLLPGLPATGLHYDLRVRFLNKRMRQISHFVGTLLMFRSAKEYLQNGQEQGSY